MAYLQPLRTICFDEDALNHGIELAQIARPHVRLEGLHERLVNARGRSVPEPWSVARQHLLRERWHIFDPFA
jgi:hypothetical protein